MSGDRLSDAAPTRDWGLVSKQVDRRASSTTRVQEDLLRAADHPGLGGEQGIGKKAL